MEDMAPELNRTAKGYKSKIQALIKYCYYCQPYYEGSIEWTYGEQIPLSHLLNMIGCPEKYWDDITLHLRCPNCGSKFSFRHEDIGVENEYEIYAPEFYRQAGVKYGKKIAQLQEHLLQYPSLGLANPLGKTLYNEIVKQRKAERIDISGVTQWFRARLAEGPNVFSTKDLVAPDIGVSSGGRYHHPGQKVLYVSIDPGTAVSEATGWCDEDRLVWVQEFRLISKLGNVLDLRCDWDDYGQLSHRLLAALLTTGALTEPVRDRTTKWQPSYLITRFLADCAKRAGFEGILYSSTLGDYNLVLFSGFDSFVTVGDPQIRLYKAESIEVVEVGELGLQQLLGGDTHGGDRTLR